MGLANQISIGRILLAPCIVASLIYYHPARDWLRHATLGLFIVGILSDAIDGLIARTQHQQSRLGSVLDPIADKLLILSTLISLSAIRGLPAALRIPAWFNLVVISRDAVLIAGTLLIFALTGKFSVQPNWLGKCTIASQMLVIAAVLLGLPGKNGLLTLVAVLTVASGIDYLRIGSRLLASES